MTINLRSPRQFWLIIVVIIMILFGVFFRVTNIDKKIYWHDEVYTSLRVAGYTKESVINQLSKGNLITPIEIQKFQNLQPETTLNDTWKALITASEHPPLYYLSLRFVQDIFGSSVIVNRGLSVFFGLLCFPTIYWLSLDLFGNNFVALITVALFSISPFHVLYAQEARQYSLWTLTIILSTLFFLKAIKSNKKSHWILYTTSLTLSLYTVLLSPLLLIINHFYLYILRVKFLIQIKYNFWLYSTISLVLFTPWLIIIILDPLKLVRRTDWLTKDTSLFNLIKALARNFLRLFFDLPSNNLTYFILKIVLVYLIIKSLIFLVKTTDKSISLYLLLLIFIPVLALFLPDLILGGVRSSTTRYLIPSYLGIQLVIAYFLGSKINDKSLYSSFILILIFIAGITSNLVMFKAETWWNKEYLYNPIVAKIINQSEKPLVISSLDKNFNPIISLSYQIQSETKFQLFSENTQLKYYPQFSDIYVFNPSLSLIKRVKRVYNGELEKKNKLLYQVIFNNQENKD